MTVPGHDNRGLDRWVGDLAIYLTRITDLPFREATHWRQLVATIEALQEGCLVDDLALADILAHRAEPTQPLRIYYGNEFCEERIPGRDELEASCDAVLQRGLSFTFVTPPVTEAGCDMLQTRLKQLRRMTSGCEVVINDWGVLQLLREEFLEFTPILGRLLNKLLRDPRVTPGIGTAQQQCSLRIPEYRRLLNQCGVTRVELDNVYQGIAMDFQNLGLRPSLHVPFGYVTTGRACLMASQHLPADRKFGVANSTCPRPCLRFEMGLRATASAEPDGAHEFTQRGNTVFYRQTEQLLSDGLAWIAAQGARLVYQPEIPF